MILSILWTCMVAVSLLAGAFMGNGSAISSAALKGAQNGLETGLTMAGALCLWTGLAGVMEKSGISSALSGFFKPFLGRIFPKSREDSTAFGSICANFTANLLGLGNAATPLGIAAVRRMKECAGQTSATDEMCRLIVLNTASIQLIPTTVAAIRAGLGAENAFDILPAVWVTSLLSASSGVLAAWVLGKRRG